MPSDRIHRRKPPRWPWLLGLVILAFALWAVSLIVDTDGPVDNPGRLSTEGLEVPVPVVVPAPANR